MNVNMNHFERLPVSMLILLENTLRNAKSEEEREKIKEIFKNWQYKGGKGQEEILFYPSRVLMQDFSGVPAIVDLAAMRDEMQKRGGDPKKINPLTPVDLVIDHSLGVEFSGTAQALEQNMDYEFEQNKERYSFLKWGQQSFKNFRVIPPGQGIVHQVNLEYLASVVEERGGEIFPDTVVGTDSHTTMINGLGVLGWGVGGIEAEAAMLGQPITMEIPEVVGVCLQGKMRPGLSATDLVLTLVEALRSHPGGVVGKFVEFYGEGLKHLSLADRATLANMAPEYGATCGYFPIDEKTLAYLELTGRSKEKIALIEKYAKEQGLWFDENKKPIVTSELVFDMSEVKLSLAGPKRPQDRIDLAKAKAPEKVVIAAITSCTNTSNPAVLVAAGLLAQKARARGLSSKSWVKTSFGPGSRVVVDYLSKANLMKPLEELGFQVVGFGCTTCIGNSGPLKAEALEMIKNSKDKAAAVLSGNRNFEGRVHALVKSNYLASPALVVAYALTGTMDINLEEEAIAKDSLGKDVFLRDLMPTDEEISQIMKECVTTDMFIKRYSSVFEGDERWQSLPVTPSDLYPFEENSSYIRLPSFFDLNRDKKDKFFHIEKSKALLMLGDSVTTDHISPAGSIAPETPAAQYLLNIGVPRQDWNVYGSRRGNHEVMIRGTFANIRIKNEIKGVDKEGGWTKFLPTGEVMPVFNASMKYQEVKTPLLIIAGKEYGTGSSRDWAAKGAACLGVSAVIAESYERIHRSNLIGMGVLPFEFPKGVTRKTLNLTGEETFTIRSTRGSDRGCGNCGCLESLKPKMEMELVIDRGTLGQGKLEIIRILSRIDTDLELQYFNSGGIMNYVVGAISLLGHS